MSDWNQSVYDYMVADESCVCAAMATRADGQLYAVANSDGANSDAGWAYIYADPQNRPMMQEDGSEKDTWIEESKMLKEAVEAAASGAAPKKFFLGGKKYVVQRSDTDYEGTGLLWITAGCSGGLGCNIFCSGATIVIGCYDESSSSGKAQINYSRDACQKMCTYMKDEAGQ